MSDHITRALEAFDYALRSATLDGLRDLHEALQTGQLAVQRSGKTQLISGSWGRLTKAQRFRPPTACPLTALFANEVANRGGQVETTKRIAIIRLAQGGYQPIDFYGAWDKGLSPIGDLRVRTEEQLVASHKRHASRHGPSSNSSQS